MKKIVNTKQEVKALWELLQHRDKWYVDVSCPDIDLFYDIAEKAKEYADYYLSRISTSELQRRFKLWEISEKIMPPESDYYFSFLNDLVWEIGLSVLEGIEKDRYEESINLELKFM